MNVSKNALALVSTTRGWEDDFLALEPYVPYMPLPPIEKPGEFEYLQSLEYNYVPDAHEARAAKPSPKSTSLQLHDLAEELAKTSISDDWQVVEKDKHPELSTMLDRMSFSVRSEDDVVDLEFQDLLKYSESFMVSGNCERSKRSYKRYQQMYLAYLAKFNLDPLVEDLLQTFMIVLHHKYSGSTLWTCYSCINAWYKATHKMNLKQWPNVTSLIHLQ